MGRRQPAYFFSGMRSARAGAAGAADASALVALAPSKAKPEQQKTLFF